MSADDPQDRKHLKRLLPHAYQGNATVHWVFNIENRETGYLTKEFFLNFQLVATHTFVRYNLVSPCICCMPDHIHLLLMGVKESSDQLLATKFLRRYLNKALHPYQFQKSPYDHVLKDDERKRRAFQKLSSYILENPFRGGLVESIDIPWDFSCAIVPGFPDLCPTADPDFWEKFWRIYSGLVD